MWGSWLVTGGRALWGLVEISVPRSLGLLLGRYWQALLLLVSAVLVVAGLLGAPGAAALGWSLLAADAAIFILRRALFGYIGVTGHGALLALATTAGLILVVAGGWQLYRWASAGWTAVQSWLA